jgi:hypothetical protein
MRRDAAAPRHIGVFRNIRSGADTTIVLNHGASSDHGSIACNCAAPITTFDPRTTWAPTLVFFPILLPSASSANGLQSAIM